MEHGHFFTEHWTSIIPSGPQLGDVVPAGGVSSGRGFTISWQHGPLGRGDTRRAPNGAFLEDIVAACIDRIEFLEQYFPCQENKEAVVALAHAAQRLADRIQAREARGVEGTHTH